MSDQPEPPNIRTSYDRWAPEYVDTWGDELDRKPFDRALLDEFAAGVPEGGRVLDVGCGPGQIGAYVADRGPTVHGVDLSHGMLRQSKRRNPHMPVTQGSMLQLPFRAQSFDGLLAFYSIIHLQREDVVIAFLEFARVLRPGGRLVVSVHRGDGDVHVDVALKSRPGETVPLYALWFQPEPLQAALEAEGFHVDEMRSRGPYDFEDTHRIYALATRMSGP